MVPGEAVQLGPEAQTALDKLRSFGSDKIDILDLVTTPTIDPKDRFRIMRTIVEPIYRELYEKDLEEEKKSGKSKDQGEGSPTDTKVSDKPQQGQGSGQEKKKWWQRKKEEPQEGKGKEQQPGKGGDKKSSERAAREAAEKKFKKEYKTYHDGHPEPITHAEEKQIKKLMEEIVAKKGGQPTLEQNILEEWAREHGNDVPRRRGDGRGRPGVREASSAHCREVPADEGGVEGDAATHRRADPGERDALLFPEPSAAGRQGRRLLRLAVRRPARRHQPRWHGAHPRHQVHLRELRI